MSKNLKKVNLVLMMMMISVMNFAMAQEAPWDDGLQKLLDILTGTTATLFATIAVALLGYLAMVGKMEWGRAGGIIGGIVLVFGAPHVVSWFS